jgi:hypothetical protein
VHGAYWTYGVCFYDQHFNSTARITGNLPEANASDYSGSIKIEVAGEKATDLAQHLTHSIQQLTIGSAPSVIWEKGTTDQHVKSKDSAGEEAFGKISPAKPLGLSSGLVPVYVSYKWGGAGEKLVDLIKERLPSQFVLMRDKDVLKTGDWISEFMRKVGSGNHVLIVIDKKYLKSLPCMTELLCLFNFCLADRNEFLHRAIPINVESLRIEKTRDRHRYINYWKKESIELTALLEDADNKTISPADREESLTVSTIKDRVSDILSWVGDTIMPRGVDSVEAAIKILCEREGIERDDSDSDE